MESDLCSCQLRSGSFIVIGMSEHRAGTSDSRVVSCLCSIVATGWAVVVDGWNPIVFSHRPRRVLKCSGAPLVINFCNNTRRINSEINNTVVSTNISTRTNFPTDTSYQEFESSTAMFTRFTSTNPTLESDTTGDRSHLITTNKPLM